MKNVFLKNIVFEKLLKRMESPKLFVIALEKLLEWADGICFHLNNFIQLKKKAIAGWTLGFLIGIIIFIAGLVIALMIYTNFFQDMGKVANLFGGGLSGGGGATGWFG